ncbi:SoxR reducing system RseC family protein [Magnetovibrio blakemorei]|uniref:Uncharacterized protein n=1 Tax=Magnetovibrio blakemorei TaxID=28181 RepID=A0A1E5Q6G6_9PROT|nr:SoxR reducing system RseC family protein [Magnetovibrio blakemorei]OEJ66249.1 hypothetical protein BEN30_12735 [Magnetovibrio blakemorei]
MNSPAHSTVPLTGNPQNTTVSGRVVSGAGGQLFVDVPRRSACKSCSKESGCGMSVLGGLSVSQSLRFEMQGGVEATPGETVQLSCSHDGLVKAALMAYLPPVLGLVAGSVATSLSGFGDGLQALGALVGLGLGLILTRALAVHGGLPQMHIHEGKNS